MSRTLITLAALIMAACRAPTRASPPERQRTLLVWIQKHPDLSAADVREGCDAWNPIGIRCVVVPDRTRAAVRILVSERPCAAGDGGDFGMAVSLQSGTVVILADCVRRRDAGRNDYGKMRAIVAHEIGHQLGVWCHVSPKRGAALMNPKTSETLRSMTALDREAYLRRDVNRARPGADNGGRECVLGPEE